jgi:hypothetical protein
MTGGPTKTGRDVAVACGRGGDVHQKTGKGKQVLLRRYEYGGGIPAKPTWRYLLASGGALRGCVRACGRRRRGGRRTAGRFAQTLDRSLGGTVFLAHGLHCRHRTSDLMQPRLEGCWLRVEARRNEQAPALEQNRAGRRMGVGTGLALDRAENGRSW